MGALDPDRYYAALTDQAERLADAMHAADRDRPVPTCPDWNLGQLAAHVGREHRWAATIVERRAQQRVDLRALPDVTLPAEPAERAEWLRSGAIRLVDAVRAAGPDATVWNWAGGGPAEFWARRMVHETAVHRADAELALGRPFILDPELAADGISEWLALLRSPRMSDRARDLLPDGQLLHLHATDDVLGPAGEWLVRGSRSGIAVEHGHGKGDVALRGPAVELLLVIMRRRPASDARVELLGNAALLDAWLAHTAF